MNSLSTGNVSAKQKNMPNFEWHSWHLRHLTSATSLLASNNLCNGAGSSHFGSDIRHHYGDGGCSCSCIFLLEWRNVATWTKRWTCTSEHDVGCPEPSHECMDRWFCSTWFSSTCWRCGQSSDVSRACLEWSDAVVPCKCWSQQIPVQGFWPGLVEQANWRVRNRRGNSIAPSSS